MFARALDSIASDPDESLPSAEEDHQDGDAPVALAPPVAPPPDDAGAPGRRRISDAHKQKILLGRAKAKTRQANERLERLTKIVAPNFSRHVAQVCLGGKAPEAERVVMLQNGSSCMVKKASNGKVAARHDQTKCVDFGMWSAVTAQAEGISSFLTHDSIQHAISINTVDDASMWVRDPATKKERDQGVRSEGMKLTNGKLWKRGGNIHIPVCSSTESVFISHPTGVGNKSLCGL